MNNNNWKKVPPRQVVFKEEKKVVKSSIICDLIWVEGVATWKPNPDGKYEYNFINKTGKLR
ncbi:hypothetical protein A3F66_07010 [candidate division TM6 bacterium RIFCSPHIGHO2_12_FULL_32_22]|nr:MAG: hypothetical protein A3F66_07010 [candidate division TM6 bacterium RIFCSPHIGHO2_12_FULL_32_22]